MKLIGIDINNIRGISSLNWRPQNGIFPNKPGIIVAPNGAGKSSFALAFASMQHRKLKPAEEDIHNGNLEAEYKLTIHTDEEAEYTANKDKNEILKRFGVAVIKCNMRPSSTPKVDGVYKKSKIYIPDIKILGQKPQKPEIDFNRFTDIYDIGNVRRGLFPSVKELFKKTELLRLLLDVSKNIKRELKAISCIIDTVKEDKRTIDIIHADFINSKLPKILTSEKIRKVFDFIKEINSDNNDAKAGLQAMQTIAIGNLEYGKLDELIDYYEYTQKVKEVRNIFSYLKRTWKGIVPKEEDGKFILRISDCQQISNGERDTLVLIANICKAQIELNKKDNILIIDELFDCLDDANIMVAQYFISQFIDKFKKEDRTIFPLILSHLNPKYFNHYTFSDFKIYYLVESPNPRISDNILSIIRHRQRKDTDEVVKNNISGNLLHFTPNYNDNIDGYNNGTPWHTVKEFKKHCIKELDSYLLNNQYDPLAVCIALREIIESYLFHKINSEDERNAFLSTIVR